ncbi:MAG: Gmad2 immunoglobulin-like domain-containing protein [Dehalococcoidia bacterium]
MLRRTLLLAATTALLTLGAACTSEDDTTPQPTGSPDTTGAPTSTAAPITDDALRNAAIPTDLLPAGSVTLEGGEYAEAAAPGSASMVEFAVEMTVVDDFNEDGVDDGAMIVRSSGGGSGTFYDLHVFLAAEGGPELVATSSLGDRIEVQGIESGPGGITVVYLTRDDETPMTDPPTLETVTTIEVAADGSIHGSTSVSAPATGSGSGSGSGTATPSASDSDGGDACADLAPEAADAAFTFVTNVASGDVLESGAAVEGCSRTFESNVPWRLEDREGNVIAQSFTMGGGVDGAAPFEFTVEYEVDEPQIGHLFVGGEDPSDGAGFPPVLNQVPVVLLP